MLDENLAGCPPPTLTDAQKEEGLRRAVLARKARASALAKVRTCAMAPAVAFAEPALARCPVETLLRAFPGIGQVRAREAMCLAAIASNRRVKGLGKRQREVLLAYLADHGLE